MKKLARRRLLSRLEPFTCACCGVGLIAPDEKGQRRRVSLFIVADFPQDPVAILAHKQGSIRQNREAGGTPSDAVFVENKAGQEILKPAGRRAMVELQSNNLVADLV